MIQSVKGGAKVWEITTKFKVKEQQLSLNQVYSMTKMLVDLFCFAKKNMATVGARNCKFLHHKSVRS